MLSQSYLSLQQKQHTTNRAAIALPIVLSFWRDQAQRQCDRSGDIIGTRPSGTAQTLKGSLSALTGRATGLLGQESGRAASAKCTTNSGRVRDCGGYCMKQSHGGAHRLRR